MSAIRVRIELADDAYLPAREAMLYTVQLPDGCGTEGERMLLGLMGQAVSKGRTEIEELAGLYTLPLSWPVQVGHR